ncbi:MAG: hypothetical protein JWL83_56 [Actinomycetia bacterium]|nr:hypothetical protein [Actinomycetes bacterium]
MKIEQLTQTRVVSLSFELNPSLHPTWGHFVTDCTRKTDLALQALDALNTDTYQIAHIDCQWIFNPGVGAAAMISYREHGVKIGENVIAQTMRESFPQSEEAQDRVLEAATAAPANGYIARV